jgi:hypothetical protein
MNRPPVRNALSKGSLEWEDDEDQRGEMMHPLVMALAAWPGRRETKPHLEAKGYWLPERYREIVLANCNNCDEAALEHYWDEVALEYFCSAGRVQTMRRKFGVDPSYRSEYLDGLASSAAHRDAASRGLPLDHSLQVFMAGRSTDFWQRIAEQMERYKRVEIESFNISAKEWTGTKGDFSKFLRKAAEARGFVFKNWMWRKAFGEVLEFCCFIDEGRRTTWRFQLPLLFEVIHNSAPDLTFYTPQAELLVPGFNYYEMYQSPESAILGIQALVDLFNSIG